MNNARTLNRRQLLALSAGAAGAFAAATTVGAAGISGARTVASLQQGATYKEAPEFAAQVKAGKLPAVADRLPKNPLVLEPVEQAGTYGGNWNLSLLPAGQTDVLVASIGYENLVRWNPDSMTLTTDAVIPNVAEKVDVSEDGKTFVFHLRAGMRWSDGEPFTADDIMFWYNDVLLNKEISPAVPPWLRAGGKPPKVTKVDANTVSFQYTAPAGLLLINMATQRGGDLTNHPAHYMKQFHKKYNPKVVNDAKAKKLESWVDLYNQSANAWNNPKKPVLNAWLLTSSLGDKPQQLTAVRNPYFWKVDSDGNQLPYMDKVVYTAVENEEVAVLKTLNGEVDTVFTQINELRNKPVFFDNKDKAGYDFFDAIPQQMNQMVLQVNMTHQDPKKREVFASKDFRIGLSYAINRQEIIDTVYQGVGEPWQAAPRPESAFYHEKLAKQYTEFDVDKANAALDKVLPKKDDKGFRLGKDGKKFFFTVEINSLDPDYANVLELVKQYWAKVGIDIAYKVEDQALFSTRTEGNQHDACVSRGGGGLGVLMDPFYYFPYNFNARYAPPWWKWFVNPQGKGASEPPDVVKQEIKIYDQIQTTTDPDEQVKLMKQILDVAADQFWAIGISLRSEEYGIVKTDMVNTPKKTVTGWLHADIGPTNPAQYAKKQ